MLFSSVDRLSLDYIMLRLSRAMLGLFGDLVLWVSILTIFVLIGYEFISTVPRIPVDKRRFGLLATLFGVFAISLLIFYGLLRVFG
ncbi:MAG: hypothetical protein DRO00_03180 [Thermoproteota archaeon]|nr:MAG: hypothetical protein DRO00_03180 [Candidatus Korarchaeota archaeon]